MTALLCVFVLGMAEPIACLDPRACEVRATIINSVERSRVATCRRHP